MKCSSQYPPWHVGYELDTSVLISHVKRSGEPAESTTVRAEGRVLGRVLSDLDYRSFGLANSTRLETAWCHVANYAGLLGALFWDPGATSLLFCIG